MIVYRKYGVRFAHALHEADTGCCFVDVLHVVHASTKMPHGDNAPASTVMLRLDKPENELRQSLAETTAYEIRRAAGRDHTVCVFLEHPDTSQLERFVEFYTEFARLSAYPLGNINWLRTLHGARSLALSVARSPSGRELVYHAYLLDGRSCRLLHSASMQKHVHDREERNMLGRANRLLHWEDIVYLRNKGVLRYDFGGWYPHNDNEHMLRVNQFKESFGGEVVFGHHCVLPCTLRGRVWLLLRRLKQKLRGDGGSISVVDRR